MSAATRPPRSRRLLAAVAIGAAVIVVVAVFAVEIGTGNSPFGLFGPPPPRWVEQNGGGNTCPNPSFLVNENNIVPTPDIGAVTGSYSYSSGCYVFALHATHANGAPFPGVFVGAWIRPATGPGSYGAPPPPGFTCGLPPPGANGGACVYVPPPEFYANGTTGSNGTAVVTIGMPTANYSVQLYAWIGGTDRTGGGALNQTIPGLLEATPVKLLIDQSD